MARWGMLGLAVGVWSAVCALAGTVQPGAILYPTQGRPVFVEPGQTFRAGLTRFREGGTPLFALVGSGAASVRHSLSATPTDDDGVYVVKVPDDVPPQTYDLRAIWRNGHVAARHAVAVGKITSPIRLVHLSNMNVGEIGVPSFDMQLVDEVNLLNPTLVVVTGDLVDATHPDPEAGWQQAADFLSRFDAPTLVTCGDHDDIGRYSELFAPSPVGRVDLGPYRGLVLYDTPANPIDADEGQLRWIGRQIADPPDALTFVLAHDACPNLLMHWQAEGKLGAMLRAGRIGLWFAGGRTDWDGREYASIVEAAAPMCYVRTHQSSTSTAGGADGVSHYRVVDIDGVRVSFPGCAPIDEGWRSIPVGRLRVEFGGANDGRQQQVGLVASSSIPRRVNRLGARVFVRANGRQRPWCVGARLVEAYRQGNLWDCRIRFDLPDKGMVRAAVGTGDAPQVPRVDVTFVGSHELPGHIVEGDDGISYFEADWDGVIVLKNTGVVAAELMPLIRLDGNSMAYRVAASDGPYATAYRLRLAPGKSLTLQVDFAASRIAPGRRELQVYFQHDRVCVPECWPLDVSLTSSGASE